MGTNTSKHQTFDETKIVGGGYAVDNTYGGGGMYTGNANNYPAMNPNVMSNPMVANDAMRQSYLSAINQGGLQGNYGDRQSMYTSMPHGVGMQSVRHSQVSNLNLPQSKIDLTKVNQDIYTKDLRQSIMEVEKSKKQIEREYYNMMATGPERF